MRPAGSGDGPAAAREVFEARRVRFNVLRMSTSVVAFGCLTGALVLYGQTSTNLTPREKGKLVPALLRLSSPDFGDGEPIPERSSKDGGNDIPILQWNAPPEGTVELAILCDDPDTPVGTWVHWVAAGIDPQTRRIEGQLPGGRDRGRQRLQGIGLRRAAAATRRRRAPVLLLPLRPAGAERARARVHRRRPPPRSLSARSWPGAC
jgi:hypothetical protein